MGIFTATLPYNSKDSKTAKNRLTTLLNNVGGSVNSSGYDGYAEHCNVETPKGTGENFVNKATEQRFIVARI